MDGDVRAAGVSQTFKHTMYSRAVPSGQIPQAISSRFVLAVTS